MVKDTVCGMEIKEKNGANAKFDGKTYHFCSPTCQWAFKENPKQFLKGKNKMKM